MPARRGEGGRKVVDISVKEKKSMDTQIMEDELRKDTSPTELMQRLPKSSLQSFLLSQSGKKRITTDALAELAALNRASLYKILNGTTRHPQRNVLLRLALVLRLSFEETQTLLRYGGRAALSGSRGRDIIISDGIIKQRTIDEVNAHLQSHYFVDLYSKDLVMGAALIADYAEAAETAGFAGLKITSRPG